AAADDLQQKVDGIDDETESHHGDRNGHDGDPQTDRGRDDARRGPPVVEPRDARRFPESTFVPQTLGAVDGGEQGANRADAAAGDDVDLDAGFMERPQGAGVIRAVGAGSSQYQSGGALRRVRFGAALGHPASSSWMVSSLTISNSRLPPGVTTFT